MTIHLVYPHGESRSAPDVIGRRIGQHLNRNYQVVLYDWDELGTIDPAAGDILIGHPHPFPGTILRRSFRKSGWSRRIVLAPFNTDVSQVAFANSVVMSSDAYISITGKWWFDHVAQSPLAHWAPKMVHVDLAVSPNEFPRVKREFAPPGQRRFLYIGHGGWQKNIEYLESIARERPDWNFGWIGEGDDAFPHLRSHGYLDLSKPTSRQLLAEYDFMITVSHADSNPMTILESMSWGLIPVCTPQSGYYNEPGIVNVPLHNVPRAVALLDSLQHAPPEQLESFRAHNDRRLRDHYCWDRLCRDVEAIVSGTMHRAATQRPTVRTRIHLGSAALRSPYSPVRQRGRQMLTASLVRKFRRIRSD